MTKTVDMVKKIWKCSEMNREARMKVRDNTVIQRACFNHIVFYVTARS